MSILMAFISSCHTTDYFLVRHAEKVDSSSDPDLSEAGMERAEALKDLLEEEGIDQVYATQYKRTQQTVQPLADAQGKEVIIYEAGHTLELVNKLKKKRNLDVVVAGHSNTIPEMVLHFTGESVHIGHSEYHHLFHIRKKHNGFSTQYILTQKTYGSNP